LCSSGLHGSARKRVDLISKVPANKIKRIRSELHFMCYLDYGKIQMKWTEIGVSSVNKLNTQQLRGFSVVGVLHRAAIVQDA